MSESSRLHLWCHPGHSPVLQYEIGPMQNLVYLVVDWSSRKALWVDPQRDLSVPEADLEKHQLTLEGILLTHTHHDHTAGVLPLIRKYPELPIYLHELDAHRLDQKSLDSNLHFLEDGHHLQLGRTFIRAIHTPGHSAGALSYEVDGHLLTGDTLFIRDCGRTDLPTGSTAQMFSTLQRYKAMDPALKIFPGHHYREEFWSTLADELRTSPPLHCSTSAELEALP